MPSTDSLGLILTLIGIFIILFGILFYLGGKFFNLGKLPGDIETKGEKWSFYFPLASSIIISIILSIILTLIFILRKLF